MKDVVHSYYKRVFEDFTILVRLNPIDLTGLELTIGADGTVEKRKLQFDEDIEDDLKEDSFKPSGALEFNLYLKGILPGRE
ncbi:hypothetical protein [Fulvivirga sedimenti]|uniref:Uncharacterized protein n=1 Tax=Fulvivirga sedimenti TaxID=2879465 RepID=A0A9X1HLM1_9BACT|nr:hypothetical protein [Fulvivirga sedimenti]MCA6073586.1 hypothetical protein [Fulvivirga sedimenti]